MIFEDDGKKGYLLAKELDEKVELLLERLENLENKNNNTSTQTSLGENEVKIEKYDFDGFTQKEIIERFDSLGTITFPPNEYIIVFAFFDVTTASKVAIISTLNFNGKKDAYESKNVNGNSTMRISGSFTNSTGSATIGIYTYTGASVQAVFHKLSLLIVGREFTFTKK